MASDFNRTTSMLLVIVILFLIMEFPHGIIYLIGSYSQKLYYEIYDYFGDLLDILVLINSSINFFLYCFMSSEFRKTFHRTYMTREGFMNTFFGRRIENKTESRLSSNKTINRTRSISVSKVNAHSKLLPETIVSHEKFELV